MKKHFMKFIVIIALISFLLFIYIKYIGVKGLIVKEYKVESSILSTNFSGVKIVHLSDILYGSTTDKEEMSLIVEKVNELKPDIIVFTGDLVHKSKKVTEKDKEYLINFLNSLDAKVGKYAVKGDYDYYLDDYDSIIESGGFNLLLNNYEKIYYNTNEYIYVVGLTSLLKSDIDIESAFSFYSDENRKYIICLFHEGNIVNLINDYNYEVDLLLAGHCLNGSIVIPYYGSLLIPKESSDYYAPEYTRGISNIFISSGIGTLKYPYRLFNKPSFNLYRLKSN